MYLIIKNMVNRHTNLFLLLIPALTFIVFMGMLKIKGPYHLMLNYDPDYVYLYNGLLISIDESDSLGHYDHPGTPLQIFNAVMIRILTTGLNNEEIINSVIINADEFINTITISLAFLYALVLAWSGIRVYKLSKNFFMPY